MHVLKQDDCFKKQLPVHSYTNKEFELKTTVKKVYATKNQKII